MVGFLFLFSNGFDEKNIEVGTQAIASVAATYYFFRGLVEDMSKDEARMTKTKELHTYVKERS